MNFQPLPPLIEGSSGVGCRATVIIPARNEEARLGAALDALAAQVDTLGHRLTTSAFEILLLLNNCTDSSGEAARAWIAANSHIRCYSIEVELPPGEAHVGTARRMLMDTAWRRLHRIDAVCAILSTDADTIAAPDWIAQNLKALGRDADAVGGVIEMDVSELEILPDGVQRAYRNDRRYQRLVAELEHLLDPQDDDPWPRHLEHFGASLACSPEIYSRAGGMPAVTPLEDVAYVDGLRRVDARLRHEPAVKVSTSSRLDGRAGIGLSHQLRIWKQSNEDGLRHLVPSPKFLIHRFQTLRALRTIYWGNDDSQHYVLTERWQRLVARARRRTTTFGEFLSEIDCNQLVDRTFEGSREEEISRANRVLATEIARIKSSPDHSAQTLVNLRVRRG